VKAAVVLHNYLIQKCNKNGQYLNTNQLKREDENGVLTPGSWEEDGKINNLESLNQLAGNRSGTRKAREQRDFMANVMLSDDLAPWQFHHALRTT
jgi:hypothetical protein